MESSVPGATLTRSPWTPTRPWPLLASRCFRGKAMLDRSCESAYKQVKLT